MKSNCFVEFFNKFRSAPFSFAAFADELVTVYDVIDHSYNEHVSSNCYSCQGASKEKHTRNLNVLDGESNQISGGIL